MSVVENALGVAHLVLRQDSTESGASGSVPEDLIGTPGYCDTSNEYDGRMGVRISSIFVILIGSLLGAWFPVWARRHAGSSMPEWPFFVAKFFGSGVIIATAFIHLLAPAVEALTNECLTGPITEYDWAEGIVLMTVMVLFFVELIAMRYAHFNGHDHGHEDVEADGHAMATTKDDVDMHKSADSIEPAATTPGQDHLGHSREHAANEEFKEDWENKGLSPESYAAQLTAIFILEFGVIFHSIFIGLTLAVSGEEFTTLYIVLVFHQTFEGLGLGSRLSAVPWPKSKRWTPYLLAIGFGISTPIAIAIGLGVRSSFAPESQTSLIANGVFDSISAGILIYTGLVELMAHEFMFSPSMAKAPIKKVISAFVLMCLGAGLMALLGKWA
ncbi:Zinc/iron permease [Lasiodiplodia theobromae]|uniref:Zinc-regulated transporter 1 n=1 Tax=Lasiodiplodia theobromae TaxID=45133 RepID=A0A5N5D049_9PEZI|nr:Plasma membrane low affinity zinc ion [Lasiodiplodia theobromae]KAB2571029.1 Zinc-regulated transporter 1 [Lasiodiplodia theobromae]KAF4534918.1 Plasma membrane low affinity zinc ion [Lasiodiplodia theobromae]KAF9641616.1 Zinc/iron permease [Lasiodiplodia theobromae]